MESDTCRERAVQARGANVCCHVARTFARESEAHACVHGKRGNETPAYSRAVRKASAIAICVVCLRSTSSSRAGRSFTSPQLCGRPSGLRRRNGNRQILARSGEVKGGPRKRFDATAPSASEKSHGTAENCRETENVSFESPVGGAEAFRRSPPSVQVLRSLCPLKTGPLQLGQGRRYTRRCLPPGFSSPCGAR